MSWEVVSCWIEGHPGLASWVQAIGSIGAILVAIWISGGERRHKAKIEKAARRDALARAIDASEHAKTTVQKSAELFRSSHPQRGEIPRHLAAIVHAAIRVKEISAGPGMDSQLLGHLYEVSNSLVDAEGLIEQYQSSITSMVIMQYGFLRQNVERIDKALIGLRVVQQ